MSTTPTVIPLDGSWEHERLSPNVLVLDYVQYSLDGEQWSDVMPMVRARAEIFAAFGIDKIQGYQPWYLQLHDLYPTPRPVWLRYVLESALSEVTASLLVEKLGEWQVSINGSPVAVGDGDASWLWDRNFQSVSIGADLREGRNVVELRSTLQLDLEIEDVYVIGDFAVSLERPTQPVLVAEPTALTAGSWTEQGYPFYAGGMRYTRTVQIPAEATGAATLRLPSVGASCVLVSVGDAEPQWLGWQPWAASLTGVTAASTVTLSVEVHSTLRNAMGPLHRTDSNELVWVGPEEFEEGDAWTDAYVLRPYGLLVDAELHCD